MVGSSSSCVEGNAAGVKPNLYDVVEYVQQQNQYTQSDVGADEFSEHSSNFISINTIQLVCNQLQ